MREEGAEAGNRVRTTVGMMETALREMNSELIQLYSRVQEIQRTGSLRGTLICIKWHSPVISWVSNSVVLEQSSLYKSYLSYV